METHKIKEIRFNLGLTQEEFAKKIGVSKMAVVHWEKNDRGLSPKHYKALKDFCKENDIVFDL